MHLNERMLHEGLLLASIAERPSTVPFSPLFFPAFSFFRLLQLVFVSKVAPIESCKKDGCDNETTINVREKLRRTVAGKLTITYWQPREGRSTNKKRKCIRVAGQIHRFG